MACFRPQIYLFTTTIPSRVLPRPRLRSFPFQASSLLRCQPQQTALQRPLFRIPSISATLSTSAAKRDWKDLPRAMPLDKSEYVSNIFNDGIFDGKVIFCTGGNGSICSAQVRALVHLGANACIVGRNTEKTEKMAADIATARAGSKVLGFGSIDVRDAKQLEAAVSRCISELGRIDYAIAGAAGNFLSPLSQLSPNAFKTVIDIDLLGSFNLAKAVLPHLVRSAAEFPSGKCENPSGRMIFVSATLHYAGTVLQTHAVAAKAGVDALSSQVCIEYGPLGVMSNVISPGPIGNTEGMDRLSKKAKSGENPWKIVPVGRMGSVKDIADATVYLFSDAANYVTGEVLVVDGGAWRTSQGPGRDFPYPEFLIDNSEIEGVAGMKNKKGESKL